MEDKDLPFYDTIKDMSNVDAAAFLLKKSKEYEGMADIAKGMANDLLKNVDDKVVTASDGTVIKIVNTTTTKVDVSALMRNHPDIYRNLCDMGAITIPSKSVKDMDIEDSQIKSHSRYIALAH